MLERLGEDAAFFLEYHKNWSINLQESGRGEIFTPYV